MKHKNIFSIGLALAIAVVFEACSQEERLTASQDMVKAQNGYYVYKIDFNCEAPGYEQGTTRAVTKSWLKGQTLFARLISGSTYALGFIIYEGNDEWFLVTTSSYFKSDHNGTCELFFFRDGDTYLYPNVETGTFDVYRNGAYVSNSNISLQADNIPLAEGSAVYYTLSGTFSQVSNTGFNAKATLSPVLWRMRFSGTNGTEITLPGNDNDIRYCSGFVWSWSSPSEHPVLDADTKTIRLTVSGGYTPYIYGMFSTSGKNKITIQNGNATYTRKISASSLTDGASGYFDIPTESNYSSNGWTKTADTSPVTGVDWTWDYDGTSTVWGNMGYCGGNGEDVGTKHNGEWWGVRNEAEFYEQLTHTSDGMAHGDESMNAHFTLGNDGRIARYAGNGTEINRGVYSFDYSVANEWKVANLNTTPGTILFPYEINSKGNMPSVFEVVYMTQSRMCLVYPDHGDFASLGSWGEATYWHFRKAGTAPDPVTQLFEEPYINWGASKSTVKTNRANNGYTLRSEYDTSLYYEPKYKESYSYYSFENNALDYIAIYFESSVASKAQLKDYVTSTGATYWFSSDTSDFYNSADGKSTIVVGGTSDVYIAYMKNSSASPGLQASAQLRQELVRHHERQIARMMKQQ